MSDEILSRGDVPEPAVSSTHSSSVDAEWWRIGTLGEQVLLTMAVAAWGSLLALRSAIAFKIFNVSFPLEFEDMAEGPFRVQLALMGWQVAAGGLFVVVFLRVRALRDAVCASLSWRSLWPPFVIGLAAAFLANAMNVWPFSFRWPGDSSLQYLSNLRVLGAGGTLILFAVSATLITPVLEEFVFRFWVLRWSVRFGKRLVGTTISAGLFAVVHAAGFHSIFEIRAFNTLFWSFVLGCVLATMAIRSGGRISGPIALHAGVNAAWFLAALHTVADYT